MPDTSAEVTKRNLEKRSARILLPKQEKWVQLMATGRYSGAEAARTAGYNTKNAHKTAARLNKNPLILEKLNKLMSDAGERNDVTLDEVISALRSARDEAMANGNFSAAIRATELLGKYLGMFTESVRPPSSISGISGNPARLSVIANLKKATPSS